MAIIRSLAIGKARKSAGNLTFATVEGRTIAREKPAFVKNPRTPAQLEQRDKMRKVVAAYRDFGVKVKQGFTVVPKYTSQYNEFVKRNMAVAENYVVDEETGQVTGLIGTQVSRGSYRFLAGPIISVTPQGAIAFDIQGTSGWQAVEGDMIVYVQVSSEDGRVVVTDEKLSNAERNMLNNGEVVAMQSESLTGGVSVGAAFYYSPANNASSTAYIQELDS